MNVGKHIGDLSDEQKYELISALLILSFGLLSSMPDADRHMLMKTAKDDVTKSIKCDIEEGDG